MVERGAKKTNAKRWGKNSSLGDSLGDTPGGRIPSPSPSPQPDPKKEKPAAKPARPADPRHQPFVDFAHRTFEAKYGAKPSWQGKDWKGLQNLLASNKSLGLEELQTRWQNYLASTEAFTVKRGGSLAYFCANADAFITGPIFAKGKDGGKKLTGSALTEANLRAAGFIQ